MHIFGESLGAQTSEDIFAEEGTEGLHRVGIDRGLFLGTPAATKFRQKWLSDPQAMDPDGEIIEVDNYEEYLALPEDVRARGRYFLLTHHNDSMPKFWFPLAVQAPDWMGPAETREPGVPKETAWRPYTTFLITFIDVKNAMNVIPGQFVANGHDYRASLARFTSLAYDLPVDDDTIDRAEQGARRARAEVGRDARHRPAVRRRPGRRSPSSWPSGGPPMRPRPCLRRRASRTKRAGRVAPGRAVGQDGHVPDLSLALVERRLSLIVEHFPIAVLLETVDRKVSQTNQAFCDLFGIPAPPEALVGADCEEAAIQLAPLWGDLDAFLARVHELLAAREPVVGDRIELTDGRVLERDFLMVPVDATRGEAAWIYRDVTFADAARREAESEARARSELLDDQPRHPHAGRRHRGHGRHPPAAAPGPPDARAGGGGPAARPRA